MGQRGALLQSAAPLGEQLLLAVVGPLVTVLLGGLAIKLLTDRVQDRRDREAKRHEQQHADSIRIQELKGRDDELRQSLVREMTEAASALYLATQHFGRHQRALGAQGVSSSAREAFDTQYLKSRLAGEVLENRLDGYFTTDDCRAAWHAVMDLLTVRYFQLIGRDTPELYVLNAGPDHARLGVDDLHDVAKVLETYQVAIKKAVREVFDQPLRARS